MTLRGRPLGRWGPCLTLTVSALAWAEPAVSQVPVVFFGRVEDAVARTPVAGARIMAPDSSAVYADSLGRFEVAFHGGGPFFVEVQQFGYALQRFDFPPAADDRVSVLLLEPIAIEVEGVSIVAESAIEEQLRDLERRRDAYPGSARALDKVQLERFFPIGTAWDVVRARAPRIFECTGDSRSGLCVRGRSRTFSNPFPEIPVLVCVDAWQSFAAVSELESLDVQQVALVEIYSGGSGGVRVYTAPFLASSARTGRDISAPLQFGC